MPTNINGDNFDNILVGDIEIDVVDIISGLNGNDVLLGLTGNDTLSGGNGNDYLDGGVGSDSMEGGTGNDTYVVNVIGVGGDVVTELAGAGTDTIISSVSITSLAANVENLTLANPALNGTGNTLANTIKGNRLNNVLNGGAGNDTIFGYAGNDNIRGGTDAFVLPGPLLIFGGNDSLDGGNGDDTLDGDNGNDTLLGGNGDDILDGDVGNDSLVGGNDDDTLIGGLGKDTMTDGAGNDRYTYTSTAESPVGINRDVLTDFTPFADQIELEAIDADLVLGGDQDFTFIGNNVPFTGTKGEIRYLSATGIIEVEIHNDFNILADMEIELLNKPAALAVGDFI